MKDPSQAYAALPVALLVAATVAAPSGSGVAVAQDALVLLDEVEVVRAEYGAWTLELPGDGVIEVTVGGAPVTANGMGFGIWMWPRGEFAAREGGVGALAVGGERVHIQALGDGGPDFTWRNRLDCEYLYPLLDPVLHWECGLSYRWRNDVVGANWSVVAVGGADGTWNGTIALRASTGARVLTREVGEAFLEREEDFKGAVNALQGGTNVILDAKSRHVVGGHLFGGFRGSSSVGPLEQLAMSYIGPDGLHSGAKDYGFEAAPPGLYEFRIDLNIALEDSFVFLIGADVRFSQ